jgi:hypothetical protein
MANAKKTTSTKKAKAVAPGQPSRPRPHVDIDVSGVTHKTRVGDLTVGQLVEILVQVHTQLPVQRGMPSPKVISDAMAAIHQLIISPDEPFKKVQAAILKQMPNILREGPYARKDGGRAPLAMSTTTRKPAQ